MKPILALQHVAHEALGLIEESLQAAGLEVRLVDIRRGELESFDPADWSGLVVMGGPMNVDETDEYPFLAEEIRWLQAAVAAQLPVLGVCLGAQLLAKSLGAKVYPNRIDGKKTKEIGWYDVQFTPDGLSDPLFAGLDPTSRTFQWHGDTFDLPAGAALLATAPTCRHQAFRYGPSAYGLQFHWEATRELLAIWLKQPDMNPDLCGIPELDPQEIARRIPDELPKTQAAARQVFGRWAKLCR